MYCISLYPILPLTFSCSLFHSVYLRCFLLALVFIAVSAMRPILSKTEKCYHHSWFRVRQDFEVVTLDFTWNCRTKVLVLSRSSAVTGQLRTFQSYWMGLISPGLEPCCNYKYLIQDSYVSYIYSSK